MEMVVVVVVIVMFPHECGTYAELIAPMRVLSIAPVDGLPCVAMVDVVWLFARLVTVRMIFLVTADNQFAY
jgi:hypothetical protein